MPKLIVENRYATIPNKIINDKNLSLKAKGLFGYIQSKPSSWKFSAKRIAIQSKDGIDAINSVIKELENYGLLKRTPNKDNQGQFNGYNYILSENPLMENPIMENHTTISKQDNSKKEIDINTILGKNRQTIKSYLEKNEVKFIPGVFDWRYAMKGADSRPNLFFIGLYWKKKDFIFNNKEEAGGEIRRLLRKSISYAKKFSIKKFKDLLEWIELDSIKKGGYEWTFETVDKRLSQYNLEN